MLVRTESLEMYHQFNGENPSGSSEIEGILQMAGLNVFIDELRAMFDTSSPFFNQVSLLFSHYRRQLANLHTETLNTFAAQQLLSDFGEAGIGIDNEGNANSEITKQILDVHGNLLKNSEITSSELPHSISKFVVFISTVQKEIIRLLIESQQSNLTEIESKEAEEEKVRHHLSNHANTDHNLAFESVQISRQAQDVRKKETAEEKISIQARLKNLFSYVDNIFNPVALGTREIKAMAA